MGRLRGRAERERMTTPMAQTAYTLSLRGLSAVDADLTHRHQRGTRRRLHRPTLADGSGPSRTSGPRSWERRQHTPHGQGGRRVRGGGALVVEVVDSEEGDGSQGQVAVDDVAGSGNPRVTGSWFRGAWSASVG